MHRGPGTTRTLPAPALFVVSGLAQYLGAALAIGLFAQVSAAGVAWLRLLFAAVVLLVWRRPWRRRWTRETLLAATAFGVVLATMNVAFYLALEHLPLGTAVAIEFLGPVAVAAVGGSGWRERVGIALAAVGVVLLAGVTLSLGDGDVVLGLVAILVAAACWAGYILLGRRVATGQDGVTSLSVAMAVGALVFTPVLVTQGAPAFTSLPLLAAVVGVAVLSSVVPYALEQGVLRRVSAATFAVLLALLPATAALVGAVVLRQWPHPLDVAGLVLVSAAIVLTSRRRPTTPAAAGAPPPA